MTDVQRIAGLLRYVALLRERLDRAEAAVRRERYEALGWQKTVHYWVDRLEAAATENAELRTCVGDLTTEIERLKHGG